jgi:hypothetical protein
MAARKLDPWEFRFLKLIKKEADAGEWANVSAAAMPQMLKLPKELVVSEYVPSDFSPGRGRAKLTEEGKKVLDVAEWFGPPLIG